MPRTKQNPPENNTQHSQELIEMVSVAQRNNPLLEPETYLDVLNLQKDDSVVIDSNEYTVNSIYMSVNQISIGMSDEEETVSLAIYQNEADDVFNFTQEKEITNPEITIPNPRTGTQVGYWRLLHYLPRYHEENLGCGGNDRIVADGMIRGENAGTHSVRRYTVSLTFSTRGVKFYEMDFDDDTKVIPHEALEIASYHNLDVTAIIDGTGRYSETREENGYTVVFEPENRLLDTVPDE